MTGLIAPRAQGQCRLALGMPRALGRGHDRHFVGVFGGAGIRLFCRNVLCGLGKQLPLVGPQFPHVRNEEGRRIQSVVLHLLGRVTGSLYALGTSAHQLPVKKVGTDVLVS